MKIIFLGTNGWYDTNMGNTPCIFLDTKDYYIIFDAGFGFNKIAEYITENKPIYLFISHFHIDHICGLHTLPKFNNIFKQGLNILSIKKAKKLAKNFIRHPYTASFKELKFKVNITELKPGKYKKPLNFICRELKHVDTTLGYRLEIEGKTIVYCSDTAICENDRALAEGADVLIHECALLPGQSTTWGHSAPESVAEMAKKAGVKQLYLTHFGADEYIGQEKRKMSEKVAKNIFPNTVAGKDGLVVEL